MELMKEACSSVRGHMVEVQVFITGKIVGFLLHRFLSKLKKRKTE